MIWLRVRVLHGDKALSMMSLTLGVIYWPCEVDQVALNLFSFEQRGVPWELILLGHLVAYGVSVLWAGHACSMYEMRVLYHTLIRS